MPCNALLTETLWASGAGKAWQMANKKAKASTSVNDPAASTSTGQQLGGKARQRVVTAAFAAAAAAAASAGLAANSATLTLRDEPRAWLQSDFITSEEVGELFVAIGRAEACWEAVSAEQATCELELDGAAPLARSAVMAKVDARVSEALGVPLSHLEYGYVQRYTANYTLHNVHLDQGTQGMAPERVASALIYLDDQPAGSGHTVFPFAPSRRRRFEVLRPSTWLTPPRVDAAAATAASWNRRLRAGRIVSRFFRRGEYGDELYALAAAACASGGGVRPSRGSALLFEHRDRRGDEAIEAAHGSCGLHPAAPPKTVLVKIATNGPIRPPPSQPARQPPTPGPARQPPAATATPRSQPPPLPPSPPGEASQPPAPLPIPRVDFCPSERPGAPRECNATEVVGRIASLRAPAILVGSPVASWPALRRWTPSSLAEALPTLPLVYSSRSGSPSFVWHDDSRMLGARLGLKVFDPHGSLHNASGRDFFLNGVAGFGAAGAATQLQYLSAKLYAPPYAALAPDAEPRAFMSAPGDLPELGGQDAVLWAGGEGTTAHPHYDPTHTAFAMVRGSKLFSLWPPERWPELALYPHAQ